MITYSIVNKSQLEGALRLDAEYYQPEYLEMEKIFQRLKIDRLGHLSIFIKKGIFDLSPDNYRTKGIPFVRVQNIRNGFLDEESLVFIPEELHTKEKKTELTSLDLVLSKVGTIGEVSIIPSYFSKVNFSQNVIGVKINKNKILPGFLLIYILSKYGQLQLTRAQMFQVQAKLELQDIRNLKIVRLGNVEREIHQITLKIEKLFENSKSLYSQAENLLLEELGLKNFKPEDDLSYIVNLSEIKSAQRADAEYFQPKYEKIFTYIKVPIKKLREITTFLNHAKQPPYVEGGKIPIITQKHLGKAFLNLEAINDPETKFTSLDWLKKYPKYKLKVGDILYYSVGAYIGKTNIVLEDLNATAASFITIIRTIEEVNPVYLTVVLNSVVGQLQSEKWESATAQQYIYPKDIENFKIPILPKSTQQKIADLVQKSRSARQKAKQLLQTAKVKVEELLEK